MDKNEMLVMVKELMDNGATLEEALTRVLPLMTTTVTVAGSKRDTIGFLSTCNSIPEVRRLRKIAYAKISKSKGKEDSVARYRLEIEAADKRLNELLSQVAEAKVPWVKAMELGEDAAGAFNYFFATYKDEVDRDLDIATKGMTRAQVKAELQSTTPKISTRVPEVLRDVMRKRMSNADMQVITTAKKVAMLYNLKKKAQ